MTKNNDFLTFRCKHRHSALTHPNCYLRYVKGDVPDVPKILVFDIETAPLKAYVFQKSIYKANIGMDQVISEWFMLCWSAKWLYSSEIMSDTLVGKEAKKEDDFRITKSLWKLIDEADIVIAHNGDSFDIPNMNTRFIVHGLQPPTPSQQIDTKVIAKKQFGFTHNSLDALAKLFGLGRKIETNFELWSRCVDGEDDALVEMETYNKEDVRLLEEIYLKLRPWIKSHPNLGLYLDKDTEVCANCGSENVKWLTDKFYYTQTQIYPLYRCECGAFGRGRKSVVTKEQRDTLGVGLAK